MTADEIAKQVLQRLKLAPGMKGRETEIQAAIDRTLEPYRKRDRQVRDVEQGKLRPYNFDGRGVQWLEREVRRKLGGEAK